MIGTCLPLLQHSIILITGYSVVAIWAVAKFDIADKNEVSGVVLTLVRPPFWNYDAHTLNEYHCNELQILLTDLI